MLAVDLDDDGTLTIDTGRGDDEIDVCVDGDQITVEVNGEDDETFDVADVESIRIEGGQGNDVIDVCDEIEVDVEVEGGKGNDIITTSSGDDDVEGGPGNDVIDTGDGDDDVEGGPGNDDITAGEGDDDVSGGPGNDTIDDEDDNGNGNGDDDDDDDDDELTQLSRGQRKALEVLMERNQDIFCRHVERLTDRGYDVDEEFVEACEDHEE